MKVIKFNVFSLNYFNFDHFNLLTWIYKKPIVRTFDCSSLITLEFVSVCVWLLSLFLSACFLCYHVLASSPPPQLPEAHPDSQRPPSHSHAASLLRPPRPLPHQPSGLWGQTHTGAISGSTVFVKFYIVLTDGEKKGSPDESRSTEVQFEAKDVVSLGRLENIKGALCSFRKDILIRRKSKQYINKNLNLEITVFICGGPCHLFQLQTEFWGPYFPLRTAFLFSYGKNTYLWVFIIFLINIVNITVLSLNFYSPVTSCSACSLFLSPERVPAEGWRLRPHPDRRWHQPDLRRHHGQHRRLRCPHERRHGLRRRRHLRWLGQGVDVRRSRAGDEGHAPGAAHGWLWAALHRPPPRHADVNTQTNRPTQTDPSHRATDQYLTLRPSLFLIPPRFSSFIATFRSL